MTALHHDDRRAQHGELLSRCALLGQRRDSPPEQDLRLPEVRRDHQGQREQDSKRKQEHPAWAIEKQGDRPPALSYPGQQDPAEDGEQEVAPDTPADHLC